MTEKTELLVINNLSIGQKVRLARIGKSFRQIDLASKAGVNISDIANVEKDRIAIVPKFKYHAILNVLGILDGIAEEGGDADR